MTKNQAPIGVFDSGLGGLTVAREIIRQMPDERIVYFGDTARVPYGSKSKETILHYTEQILNFLKTQEVKAIVAACNTVSAYALAEVKSLVDIPMIGVLEPGARVAVQATETGRVGVIGTEGTIRSGQYEKFIHEMDSSVQVFGKACPLLCPLVEEGWWHDDITRAVLERYLFPLKDEGVDTLIMGCTHYPLLRSTIRSILGESVNLVNPAFETAVELRRLLERADLAMLPSEKEEEEEDFGKYRFYVSDDPERFRVFATSVLRFMIPNAEKINIEEY